MLLSENKPNWLTNNLESGVGLLNFRLQVRRLWNKYSRSLVKTSVLGQLHGFVVKPFSNCLDKRSKGVLLMWCVSLSIKAQTVLTVKLLLVFIN